MRGRQVFLIARSIDGVVGELQRPLQEKIAPRRIERLLRGDGAKQVVLIALGVIHQREVLRFCIDHDVAPCAALAQRLPHLAEADAIDPDLAAV